MSGRKNVNTTDTPDGIARLREALLSADAVIIGAGAGLSAAAGLDYSGEKFDRYFGDFAEKYGISDMYSGGFYPFKEPEILWAWWSRHIYVNRYTKPLRPVYEDLLDLLKDKDYFVLTTNVDHQFQKAGFDKERLFYTQGDYGLWQCRRPCHKRTYDNKGKVVKMLLAQGFAIGKNSELIVPELDSGDTDFGRISMQIPSGLVPYCPVCGEMMRMNLRSDDTFVEDEGWHMAAERYTAFLDSHRNMKVLFLELGVGFNTPGIIKYNFWKMTNTWPDAVYACLNFGEAFVPKEISSKSILISADVGDVLCELKEASTSSEK